MEQQTEKKSSRTVWIVVGAVVVFCIVLGVAIYLIVQSNTKKTSDSTTAATSVHVSTKSEVQQNLSNLNNSVKQAKADQSAAKTVLENSKTQVKIGN